MSLSIQFHVPLCVFVMMCLVMAVRPKHVAWLSKKECFYNTAAAFFSSY